MRHGRPHLAILSLLILHSVASAAILRVRPDGSDLDSGADWQHAKATVQAAINAASEGDEIWVAAGTYPEHLQNRIVSEAAVNVALYGGFAGDETSRGQRDPAAHRTVLDGTDSGIVLRITGGAGPATRIDGFDIRRGHATGMTNVGGGIYVLGSGPVIANNRIVTNLSDGIGGGILLWGYRIVPPAAQAAITDNQILENRSGDGGAGIAIVGASPEIGRNVLARNYTSGQGGGIGCWTTESSKICSPRIANNRIYENAANYKDVGSVLGGGGIFATADGLDGRPIPFAVSAPLIVNNLIAANGAVAKGGGVAVIDSGIEAATITNNTVFANNGSGIYWSQTFPAIANNIVAYNTWGLERENEGATPAPVRRNDVFGNTLKGRDANFKGIPDPTGANGNISLDPRMVEYTTGRFHVQPDSPCVGAGDNAAVGDGWTDIEGQPRILGAAVDLGADESDGTSWDDTVPVIHVRSDGDDGSDGRTWANAKRSVTSGIDAAHLAGAQVWVAAGTYAERFRLPAWVALYGGFAGSETSRAARDPSAHPTILDGGGTPTVVFSSLAGHLVSAIDGFTVRNGGMYTGGAIPSPGRPGGRGGGIDCNVSSPRIVNNVITRNSLGDPFTTTDSSGAGIGLYGSYAAVSGNTLVDNEVLAATGQGGAIYGSNAMPLIEKNDIRTNHARYGSAIYATNSAPRIVGNTIVENSHYLLMPVYFGSPEGAVDLSLCHDFAIERNLVKGSVAFTGAGIIVQSTFEGRIESNVVSGNVARDSSGGGGIGGGIYVEVVQQPTGDIVIANNTLVGNTASSTFLGERGGGLAIVLLSNAATVANNTIAFNSSGIWRNPGSTGNATLSTNDVYNTGANYINLPTGPSDVSVDPAFVNRAAGDYHLAAGSPAVDAGTNGLVPGGSLDFDGAPRVLDGDGDGSAVVDLGAYEYSTDHDGDGTPDAADCAPFDGTVWASPAEVAGVAFAAGGAGFSWGSLSGQAGPGTSYDVMRGSLAELPVGTGATEECLREDLAATSWSDTAVPAQGAGFYYLVRGRNVCGIGTYGSRTDGAPRTSAACP